MKIIIINGTPFTEIYFGEGLESSYKPLPKSEY